jgi:acyl carrier protein
LAQHPAVQRAVVLARKDGPGEQKLVAYCIFQLDHAPTANELREFLKARLPEHMVPYAYVTLDVLPLTVNGKIDRAALPAPVVVNPTAYESATTELERVILEIWSKVLGISGIGLDDNFFDRGGDSLLLATVHLKLQEVLKADAAITDLFEFPTVRSLTRYLSAKSSAQSSLAEAHQRAQKQRAAFARKPDRRILGAP